MSIKNRTIPLITTAILLITINMTACNVLSVESTPDILASSTATASPEPVFTLEPPARSDQLTIWVPPTFVPETDAGILLADHLQTFETNHPGVEVRVRIKDEEGPAGLLETLTSASLAAPSTLPDVISLDPDALETAALKDLIVHIDELTNPVTIPELYDFADGIARIDGQLYGLPYMSLSGLFLYYEDTYSAPQISWEDILDTTDPFLFPAGDPEAKFTLAQYLSLGGSLNDEDGEPYLDPATLEDILGFYTAAEEIGILPLFSLQLQTSDETWTALTQLLVSSADAPLERYLEEENTSSLVGGPWPTRNGAGINFAYTYSWAAVATDLEQDELVSELLDWLMMPEFLGSLTQLLGTLPTTQSALAEWTNNENATLANRLIRVTIPEPKRAILDTYGPPLQAAVEDVLNRHETPQAAAVNASQEINNP
ncbi:MAG: extracellular solute-binding protein [Anaerolineales bacterium]|nr:extracellular solute-binding protein [Anaerolineales bacterium]